jgi:hypothetical protein
VALAVLAALTAAGCGGSGQGDGASSGGGGGSKSRSESSGSPSADRAASPKPSVSAADGRDTAACEDGNCEIAVSKRVTVRFKGPSGRATLSVTEVGPNKIEYTVKSGSSQSKGGAGGSGQGCITVVRSNGGGNSCGRVGHTPPSAEPDAVVIQVATGKDGTALLQMVSD